MMNIKEDNNNNNDNDNDTEHEQEQEQEEEREKEEEEEVISSKNGGNVGNVGNAWKSRLEVINLDLGDLDSSHVVKRRDIPPINIGDGDNEIDLNLLGMYQRGFELQLSKMHFASDAAYQQIMEDIATNGISQSDIYQKYHIDFIPDQSSFKLIPPPSIIDDEEIKLKKQKLMRLLRGIKRGKINKNNNNISNNNNMEIIRSKMVANSNSKTAFKNFYALTRMQQKYLGVNGIEDIKEDDGDIDIEGEDEENMNVLRDIQESAPLDVLNVILNDDKLPQWLYESDTILDLNCGIGDSLIYLLHNFTTIRGICVVGTNDILYKYAKLNIANNGLSQRIDIINKDLYDPLIKSLYNKSDIIYIDWYNGDEEYLNYFINDLMNDPYIRSAKPGRVILSYNKLLFDEDVFQASYTLHFASGWNLKYIQNNKALTNDVSMYMYSIPMFLSKLSNLYVQNYQVFYGYHPIFSNLDFKFDFDDENKTETATETTTGTATECVSNLDEMINGENTMNTNKPNSKSNGGETTSSPLQYDYDNYVHLNNAIFQKISSMAIKDVNDDNANKEKEEEAIFEIITSGMNVNEFDEIGEIQKIWTMISSQLLYQSFINGIQHIISMDVENENSQILLKILNSINDRHRENNENKEKEKEKKNKKNGNNMMNMDDEWEYLEYKIFNIHRVDSCALYQYIRNEWEIELNSLLKEFDTLFFYDSVKEAVALKMESLLAKCD